MAHYSSPRGRATWAVALLGIIIAVDLGRIISGLMQMELLERMASGTGFTMAEAHANDDRVRALAIAYLLALVISAVTFLRWFHRAASNHDIFQHINIGSGASAVWSFFIPFVNLFRPYQIMKSIWNGSASPGDPGPSWVVSLWWAAWLGSNFLAYFGTGFLGGSGKSARALANATLVDVVHVAVNLVAAALAILVIRGVTRRQDAFSSNEIADEFD